MIKYGAEDYDGFDFSVLDRAKIEDLGLGEHMKAENDSFIVTKQKNGYHIWCTKGKRTGVIVLPSLEKVLEFLHNN